MTHRWVYFLRECRDNLTKMAQDCASLHQKHQAIIAEDWIESLCFIARDSDLVEIAEPKQSLLEVTEDMHEIEATTQYYRENEGVQQGG